MPTLKKSNELNKGPHSRSLFELDVRKVCKTVLLHATISFI